VYATETGGGIEEAVHRLQVKAKKRLEGLEFVESRRLGWKLYRLVEVFLNEFGKISGFEDVSYAGKFVVLEGISGSGKDTQAKLLSDYLVSQGKKARVVNHPTEFFKGIWKQWREEVDDRNSELFMLLADRVRMVLSEILPALKRGEIVISTRSSVSAQAYQASGGVDESLMRFMFTFEPVADLLVYLDLPVEMALERADERVKKGSEQDRGFFGDRQTKQKEQYEKVMVAYPNIIRIDAGGSVEEVFELVKSSWVEKCDE
jgi:dTMP kinase